MGSASTARGWHAKWKEAKAEEDAKIAQQAAETLHRAAEKAAEKEGAKVESGTCEINTRTVIRSASSISEDGSSSARCS
jgi:hypothetical protein